jgi:hypothetical protein
VALSVAVVVGLLLASAAALWATHQPSQPVQFNGHQHGDLIEPPPDGLSADAHLDRMAQSPDFQGVLHGRVTGAAVAKAGRLLAGGQHEIFSDHPLAVLGVAGAGGSRYGVGAPILLRVPGGTTGGVTVHAEDAPTVNPGDEVFVIVANYGVIAGGNQPGVLVSALRDHVFFVRGSRVQGQGYWQDVDEPVAQFEAHFGFPPS